MKTFMSRMALFVSLTAVALVCRWKGCSQQSAGGSGVGEGPSGPAFEKSRVPPRPPSLQPANAVVRRSAARALRAVSSLAK